MKKILTWLDNHILLALTAILIVVIPAYPKLPIADLIEGYIVRLRLEDILVLFSLLVCFVQLLRHKITFPKNIISKLMSIGIVYFLKIINIDHENRKFVK